MATPPFPRIVLLAGSTDAPQLYDPLRHLLPQIETPPFPLPQRHESLPHYARRTAELLRLAPPIIVGGTSFGGMVTLEMTHVVPCAACLLISSAMHPDDFPTGLQPVRRIARRVGPLGPPLLGLAQRVVARLPTAWVGTRLRNACRNALRPDEAFRRWSWGAALRWRGASPTAPTYQIHGALDTTLKPPVPGPHVTILPDAGHMLVVTHAAQVAAWLIAIVADTAPGTQPQAPAVAVLPESAPTHP